MIPLLTNGIICPPKTVQTHIPFTVGGEIAIEKKDYEISIEKPELEIEVNLCLA